MLDEKVYNKFRKAPFLLLIVTIVCIAASVYFIYLGFQFDEQEKWCLTACQQEKRTVRECIKEVCSINNDGAAVGFAVIATLAATGYALIWVYTAEACLTVVKSFK